MDAPFGLQWIRRASLPRSPRTAASSELSLDASGRHPSAATTLRSSRVWRPAVAVAMLVAGPRDDAAAAGADAFRSTSLLGAFFVGAKGGQMDERLRVLIAEDEAIIRLDLRACLERAGVNVCAEARDGEEAVELARAAEPDVVLLD